MRERAFAPVMTGDAVHAPGALRAARAASCTASPTSRRSSRCRCPSRTSGGTSARPRSSSRCPARSARSSTGWCSESGWKVTERSGEDPVAVSAKHVCLLFRRFISWQNDVTRPYVEALEARGIPHVLVGGKAFHEREEVEAIRAALAAIEWPDDELSVFATLRGPFFADRRRGAARVDASLRPATSQRFRRARLHPFRMPAVFDGQMRDELAHLRPIADALRAAAAAASPPQLRAGRRHAARAARRDARARRLRAAHRRRAGAGQRASRRGAGAPVRERAAASRSAASSTSCASPPRTRRRQRRRSSKRTATACG